MTAPSCPCLCEATLVPSSRYAPYAVCPQCGSGWKDLPPATHWSEEPPTQEALDFWGSRAAQWTLATEGRHSGRLLDVGCAYGHFVQWADDNGWDAWGVEPELPPRTQTVARSDRVVAEVGDAPGPFDLITLWDVLEHVSDPSAFLRQLAQALAPGGRIFVSSPDFNALKLLWPYLRSDPVRFQDRISPHEHHSQFTRRGLQHLLRRSGLVDVRRLYPPLARGPRLLRPLLSRLPRPGQFVVATRG